MGDLKTYGSGLTEKKHFLGFNLVKFQFVTVLGIKTTAFWDRPDNGASAYL
jgi:hypothetical protein